jgi:hypothetical protein
LRIRADEHIARKIIRAVRELILRPGWEFSHVEDAGDRGVADDSWITRFGQDGGHAILSADRNILHRPNEVMAISNAGVRAFFLAPKWAMAKRHIQAAQLILWWPHIEKICAAAKPRECYRIPFSFGEGKIERISVDFEKARKRAIRSKPE